MRKLRVGIWLKEGHNPEAGGGFGYYFFMLNLMKHYSFKNAEIIFLTQENITLTDSKHKTYRLKERTYIKPIKYFFARKVFNKKLTEEVKQVVDVVYYLVPGMDVPNVIDIPYIYTLWDLGHLTTYPFPEIFMFGDFEKRKIHHEQSLSKALMIIVESETGKKHLKSLLPIYENKIRIIPMIPSPVIDAGLLPIKPAAVENNTQFIHYPAQYWAHKNHYNLINAFKIILNHYPNLKLILTGSDKGNKDYIIQHAKEQNVFSNLIDLGFVSLEELKWLYLNSSGLVMASFLGPTNMPVLEAKMLDCPVACSDLEGHREQLGDYAIYFNPEDVDEMASAILQMLHMGTRKSSNHAPFNNLDILKNLDHYFSEAAQIRFCWE